MAAEQTHRPSWLTEPCPSWCANEHREEDHLEDRVHKSAGLITPAVVRRSPVLADVEPGEATEILVQTLRLVGATETWVLVCEPENAHSMMMLRHEAATGLADALRALTRVPDTPDHPH